MAAGQNFPWRQFWRHCIAVALITRAITDLLQLQEEDVDYVGGLIHDVGKIVMATAFPVHFEEIYHRRAGEGGELMAREREVLGVDHADLGAMYLRRHGLPEMYVEIVQYHHAPHLARYHGRVTAAVQVADLLARQANIGYSGNRAEVPADGWMESPGGKMLFGQHTPEERRFWRAILESSLKDIPAILDGIL